ncbi:hypothetical protein B0H11DRAFT_2063146 [Mycena galericulata]|nr:hypothetical protein B0H11DRAFT_2063146 [Mycena galericulata]
MSTSNKKGLVAFPSVSSSLNSLPRATSMSNVSLHPNMYKQRAQESEAKLQHAFTKPILNPNSPLPVRRTFCVPFCRIPTGLLVPVETTHDRTSHDAHTTKIEMNAASFVLP